MDEQDINLWQMCDVGYYGGFLQIFVGMHCNVSTYIKKQKNTKTHINKIRERLVQNYYQLHRRYNEIDIDKLDSRFPVAIMSELKNRVLPELGYILRDAQRELNAKELYQLMESCMPLIRRMDELGTEFMFDEFYVEYRKLSDKLHLPRKYMNGSVY